MAEDKTSFLLYCDLIHTVRKMPRELRGDLFLHILEYVNDENPQPDDVMVDIAFEPIKQQLKRDLKKYEQKREGKSIGGRVGNLKRWNIDLYDKYKSGEITLDHAEFIASDRKASDSDESDRIASDSIAKIAVNDSVSVNGNVSDSDIKEKKSKKRFAPPSLEMVYDFFIEKKIPLGQARREADKFIAYYESNGWKVGKNKMQKWKAAAAGWLNRLADFEKEKSSAKKEKESAGEIAKRMIYESSKD